MDGPEPLGPALCHHSGRDLPGKSARCRPITASTGPQILAARLLALRSRLLFAADPAAAHDAELEAARALAWLRERPFVRAAADWLEARPQLGRDVFARPVRDRDPRVTSYMTLMEACLTLLEREEEAASNQAEAVYRPNVAVLHRIPDALARMRARLATLTEPAQLRTFLPRLPADVPDRERQARSAVSSTLVAALELGRNGELTLSDGERFETVSIAAPASGAERAATLNAQP